MQNCNITPFLNIFSPVRLVIKYVLAIVMSLAVISATGCVSSTNSNGPIGSTQSEIARIREAQVMAYVIGPSDVVSISVWSHAELNKQITVRPDGKISFYLVGDIAVAGLTPVELQTVMETSLGQYMDILPGEVSVVVDEVHSYKVSVLGEVRLPGRFEFQSQVSVLDALAQAGGLTEYASSTDIIIFRPRSGEVEKILFDYRKMVRSKENDDLVLIYPGDIILVP